LAYREFDAFQTALFNKHRERLATPDNYFTELIIVTEFYANAFSWINGRKINYDKDTIK